MSKNKKLFLLKICTIWLVASLTFFTNNIIVHSPFFWYLHFSKQGIIIKTSKLIVYRNMQFYTYKNYFSEYDLQYFFIVQFLQSALRDLQVYLPCQINKWFTSLKYFLSICLIKSCSILLGSVSLERPILLEMRLQCVSTAIPIGNSKSFK